MRVRFADYVFDSDSRLVTRNGETLDISPKAFVLLSALLERRPAAVAKTELQDLLWPKTYVSYTSLAGVVSELRQVLRDDRVRPRFIRTVHGFGYAFCGEVTAAGSQTDAPYTVLLGRREVPLTDGENLIGRAGECAVRIDSGRVSRQHARICICKGRATIEDLGSKNGTLVSGRGVEGVIDLKDGDEIVVGPVALIFRSALPAGSTETGTGKRRRP